MAIETSSEYVEVAKGRVEKREKRIGKFGFHMNKTVEDERAAWEEKTKAADGTVVDLKRFRGEAVFRLSDLTEKQLAHIFLGANVECTAINEEKQLVYVRFL